MIRDPSLANEPIANCAHQSDRYCHQRRGGSMCGYLAVGRLADGSTACEDHFHSSPEGRDDER